MHIQLQIQIQTITNRIDHWSSWGWVTRLEIRWHSRCWWADAEIAMLKSQLHYSANTNTTTNTNTNAIANENIDTNTNKKPAGQMPWWLPVQTSSAKWYSDDNAVDAKQCNTQIAMDWFGWWQFCYATSCEGVRAGRRGNCRKVALLVGCKYKLYLMYLN